MSKPKLLTAAAILVSLAAVPAASQMIGTVGNNPGQSPQDARELDQKFDQLRDEQQRQRRGGADELAVGADLVHREKFADAIPHLERALAQRPRDVTTLIYLGFSHRMLGSALAGDARQAEFAKALDCYRRGLELDSRNRLLHEYAGKVHILLHDQAAAEAELKALGSLCPSGCDELDALTSALAAYEINANARGAQSPSH